MPAHRWIPSIKSTDGLVAEAGGAGAALLKPLRTHTSPARQTLPHLARIKPQATDVADNIPT